MCDFGGTGTSIALADAGRGFAPMSPTVRYVDLSGDLIDQALLTYVIADLSAARSLDLSGTSAIGSLTRLRGQCRAAKERLSTTSVTSLTAEVPGHQGRGSNHPKRTRRRGPPAADRIRPRTSGRCNTAEFDHPI